MNYYAPFYQPYANYAPNIPSGMQGQTYPTQGQNSSLPITTSSLPSNNDNSMIWVLGKNEAESYPVAPNCQVILWDKNAPTIYVKSMSASNVPNLRVLDFTERSETAQSAPKNDFNVEVDKLATKDDITALRGEIERLTVRCDALEQYRSEKEDKAPKTDKKSKGSDE